jgi:uncharacterized RDD family membrane protein YckC
MPADKRAGLPRRLVSLIYEALLLAAVLLAAGLIFTLLFGDARTGPLRYLLQAYLATVSGVYFAWQWQQGGQTLPMKTWKMRVEMADGAPLTLRIAAIRYVLALAGLLCLGLGFLWALADRDRQFLHDRLAGTRIVMSDK